MDFNLGERVVHPSFGIGKVITVEEMVFNGQAPSPFYRVVFGKTTLWVPVNPNKVGGIRPITPVKDLRRYRLLLKSAPAQLDDNFRKRQEQLEVRLGYGTFQALCEVVRDLSARVQIKNLNKFETALLKQTREALVQEWALASGLSPGEAGIDIDRSLQKGRQ
ncbi:MAG TPA: CarD family transcriptional regulator [Anaerolineales bacterium]|jgi:CarD family transcriptional regulator|nr:CarD family transcriptional regulator [Anaerolineales bacterium]